MPLWVADMDFSTPLPILDALQSAIGQGILGYEHPSRSLLETVAKRVYKLYNWNIQPEMVVPTPGIVSGFNAAARAVCAPGEGVLMQPPVYFPFLAVHENIGLTRQFAPLVRLTDGNFLRYEIDFDSFEAAMGSNDARTAMFLLCNPHNPTGNALTREQLSQLAEICLRKDITICSDEIHSELLLGGAKHTPIAALSPEIAEKTITLISPSKTFNTAGLFCGFAVIPNQGLRERYQKTVQQMTLHVSSLGLVATQAAFSGACDDWLDELLVYLTANRDFLVEFVRENIPGMRLTVPEATYMSLLDCSLLVESGRITDSPFDYFLKVAKVALSDGATFGPGGEGTVRLNFGCPRSLLEQALLRIKASLR